MPDLFNNRSGNATIDGAPNDWVEAFAALPMEAPPGDGWQRLARKLDARSSRGGSARRERRMTWLIGVASAAVLVLAVWSPLSRWQQADEAQDQPAAVIAQAAPGMRGPAAPIRTEPDQPRPEVAQIEDTPPAASTAAREATSSVHRKPARHARSLAARRHAEPETASASEPPAQESVPTLAAASSVMPTAAPDADPLQKLQAQSAQLEALVALARDDRVGNASSELLSSELDAGIAVVDAALSQADLSGAQKRELWQQRVDLLQQLAGVEATSRWLAAQGSSSSTNLVAVD
ncbi:hypothetical protein ACFPOA_15095 [Lysobacter niabensis]|uniref:hypothetical protein n=1 Tax=Agrilutibacter niabensis TaxID=380628 RepID=UPI00361AF948